MESNALKLSVILPCHNLENYIGRCLESIKKQSIGKEIYEVIVVLDSCDDKSEEVVKKSVAAFKNYEILKCNYHRAGLTRNDGLKKAKGKIIWFIDGDDYLLQTDAFKQILSEFENDENLTALYLSEFVSNEAVVDEFAVWRYIYKKDFIDGELFNDKMIDEDWDYTQKISKKRGYKQKKLNGKIYFYTYGRDGSITSEYNKIIGRMKGETPI